MVGGLVKKINEYKDAIASNEMKNAIALLQKQADEFGGIDIQLEILNKLIQATERNLVKLARTPGGIDTKAYKDAADSLVRLKEAYIDLESALDLRYVTMLYNAFGTLDDRMNVLSTQTNIVENKLRALLEHPLNTEGWKKSVEELITQLGQLRAEAIKMDAIKDSFSSIGSVFQTVGQKMGNYTGELISWFGQLLSDVPEIIGLFEKYGGVLKATTAATNAAAISSELNTKAKITENATTGLLAATTGGATIATQAHVAAKVEDTAATQVGNMVKGRETGIMLANMTAKTLDIAATKASSVANMQNTATSLTQSAADSGAALAGVTKAGSKLAFPYNLIAIAAGVAAVVAALATTLPKAKMARGGKIPEGYPNDTYHAMLSSGEVVIPKNRRKDMKWLSKMLGWKPMKVTPHEKMYKTLSKQPQIKLPQNNIDVSKDILKDVGTSTSRVDVYVHGEIEGKNIKLIQRRVGEMV